MTLLTRLFAALALFSVLLPALSAAQRLKGQAVTWANFDYVYSVTSSNTHVYFATTEGITRYSKLEYRWEEPLTGADGALNETAKRIRVNRFDDRLYITTDLSHYEYDDLFERWVPVNELPRIDNDNVHVNPPRMLLPQFDANYMGEGEFVDYQGRSFLITDVVDDKTGDLWMGTWGHGAARADKAAGLTELLPYGLLQNRVNVLFPDDTVIWISGAVFDDFRTGLTAFNPEENSFYYVESGVNFSFPAVDVNCLTADEEHLYVGTPLGVYFVSRNSWSTKGPIKRSRGLLADNVLSLCAMGKELYVGTVDGLSVIDMATDSIFHVHPKTLANQLIYDLVPVDSTLWIAAETGAFRYTPATGRLQEFQDRDLVLFGRVYEISRAGPKLWFSSDNGVVSLDINTGENKSYQDISRRADSRPIAANSRIVAYASDRGLTIRFLDRNKPFKREFTTDDGLASSNVFALLMDGPYVWVGTDRGLTRFLWDNPDRVD
jgi:ligand-binding sensor domain-containing protein